MRYPLDVVNFHAEGRVPLVARYPGRIYGRSAAPSAFGYWAFRGMNT